MTFECLPCSCVNGHDTTPPTSQLEYLGGRNPKDLPGACWNAVLRRGAESRVQWAAMWKATADTAPPAQGPVQQIWAGAWTSAFLSSCLGKLLLVGGLHWQWLVVVGAQTQIRPPVFKPQLWNFLGNFWHLLIVQCLGKMRAMIVPTGLLLGLN